MACPEQFLQRPDGGLQSHRLSNLSRPCALPAVSGLKRYLGGLPSAVFQKSQPGRKWGVGDRAATYVKLGLEYSLGESRLFVFCKRLFGSCLYFLRGCLVQL